MTEAVDLVRELREMASRGAGLLELLERVHAVENAPRYDRGLVMFWFSKAFELDARDFTDILFACELFGDGASLSAAEADRRFRARLTDRRTPHW